ncbi:hypothetical protein HYY71_06100 [Candidatus Woesearchaeota archaeon]|nr:hypothetical protein [Candidatus Woesearchaeota archaeon]
MDTSKLMEIIKECVGSSYDLFKSPKEPWKVRVARQGLLIGAVTIDEKSAHITEGRNFRPRRDRGYFLRIMYELQQKRVNVVYSGPYFST